MAELDFDDSLLTSQENLGAVDWDNVENFGVVTEGRHLATIKSVNGYMFNFKEYTGPRAKVKFVIKEGPDKGKFVYDDINLPHHQEKDGNVKRRALIASRMGLVQKGSKETVQVNWKVLEGRDVWITVEHSTGEKDGKKKVYANVTFDGWEAPEGVPQAPATAGYPDI
jgi:hypothetical protein